MAITEINPSLICKLVRDRRFDSQRLLQLKMLADHLKIKEQTCINGLLAFNRIIVHKPESPQEFQLKLEKIQRVRQKVLAHIQYGNAYILKPLSLTETSRYQPHCKVQCPYRKLDQEQCPRCMWNKLDGKIGAHVEDFAVCPVEKIRQHYQHNQS